jgi:hypothetical protein
VKLAPSIVGLALNTARPVPVSSVRAPARFALLGVAKNVATPTPSPVKPVVGRPVQLVKVPDDGRAKNWRDQALELVLNTASCQFQSRL